MSHWADCPSRLDRWTGEVSLPSRDPRWSLERAEWVDRQRVVLRLRRHPGDHAPPEPFTVVDCVLRPARLGESLLALAALEEALVAGLGARAPARRG